VGVDVPIAVVRSMDRNYGGGRLKITLSDLTRGLELNASVLLTDPDLGENCASVRRALLTAARPILDELGLSPPPHIHVEWKDLTAATEGERASERLILEAMQNAVLGDQVFVQAAPHDESRRADLSFAGCFKTYHPRRARSGTQNMLAGLRAVLSGRSNRYCDLYYDRHGIGGDRIIDVKIASLVPRVQKIGTGYALSDRALVQTYDSYVSLYTNDPARLCWIDGQRPTYGDESEITLAESLSEVSSVLGQPLDVEFVTDAEGRVFVSQVRPISVAHRLRFAAIHEDVWQAKLTSPPGSVIPGSVGRFDGVPVDLRARAPQETDLSPKAPIYVIRHSAQAEHSGVSALDFMDWANRMRPKGFGLIIDHGAYRQNDHLDYILGEDPDARFVIAATSLPPDLSGATVTVTCDGFDADVSA
jgi:hypothetical protein